MDVALSAYGVYSDGHDVLMQTLPQEAAIKCLPEEYSTSFPLIFRRSGSWVFTAIVPSLRVEGNKYRGQHKEQIKELKPESKGIPRKDWDTLPWQAPSAWRRLIWKIRSDLQVI